MDLWREAERQARSLAPETLVRLARRVPYVPPPLLYRAARSLRSMAVRFWYRDGRGWLALGDALQLTSDGQARGSELETFVSAVQQRVCAQAPADLPLVVGGWAFSPGRPGFPWTGWSAAEFALPRLLFTWQGEDLTLVVTRPAGLTDPTPFAARRPPTSPSRPGPDPATEDFSAWQARVEAALAAIDRGELDKVVLARMVTVPGSADDATVLERLWQQEEGVTFFALADGRGAFLGASPEMLFHRTAGEVEVMCLAGSARRSALAAEDAALGEALLSSAKDRREHDHVVAMVTSTLTGLGLRLRAPGPPRLRGTRHVQHLYTPVLAEGRVDAARLLAALHPTPAVGGVPRAAALAWLERSEGFARGFYAGAVGYIAANGDAEFTVALRSALVRGDVSYAFAGCGIVAGSSAASEYAEAEWKLRPLLDALSAAVPA